MTTHYLRLPWGPTPYLHANQRLNRFEHASRVAQVREAIGFIARSARVGRGHPHITVGLVWRPKVRRRRDGAENLGPLQKALIDGLVEEGVVPDDVPGFVTRMKPVLLEPGPNPGLVLVVDTGPKATVDLDAVADGST